MMHTHTVLQSMRIPFLLLTPVCVFLGMSVTYASKAEISIPLLLLALLGALLAHISVNTLNEYYDFKSGLDLTTIKTPFSGGSGALPDNPKMQKAVFSLGIISLMATLMVGIFFIWEYGTAIIPIGLAGMILIVTYTGWINKHPFLCLIAPGIGFGFLMVAGTQFVLQGEYLSLSWFVALIPFFLVNNLLLLNQYPDKQADADAGRNHFPIAYGIKRSNMVYGFFILATVAAIVGLVVMALLPAMAFVALLPIPLAVFSLIGAIKHGDAIGSFPQYLGANVAVTLITPLLLGLSIMLG